MSHDVYLYFVIFPFLGHLFCLDCLTRMCGTTFGSCPFCRTAFSPEDIRWLFFNFELESFSDGLHYPSSDSTHCPTVLEWLFDARDDLEKRVFEVSSKRDRSNDALWELQAEINAWLSAYEATGMPRVPVGPLITLPYILVKQTPGKQSTRSSFWDASHAFPAHG
jgi:hypothetical protein